MKTTELFTPFREKYAELKKALKDPDIEKIKKLTLGVHVMDLNNG